MTLSGEQLVISSTSAADVDLTLTLVGDVPDVVVLAGTSEVQTARAFGVLRSATLSGAAAGLVSVKRASGEVLIELWPGELVRPAELVQPALVTTRDPAKEQYGKPGYEFPAGNLADYTLTERGTADSQTQPLAFGSAHPKNSRLLLIGQKLTDGEDNKRVQVRVYASRVSAAEQKGYGYGVSYPYALKEFPRVTWNVKVLKADYEGLEFGQACLVSGYEELTLTGETFQPDAVGVFGTLALTYDVVPGPVVSVPEFLETGLRGTRITQTVFLEDAEEDSGPLVVSSTIEPQTALVGVKTTLLSSEVFDERQVTNKQQVSVPEEFFASNVVLVTESRVQAGTSATPNALGEGGIGVLSSVAQMVRADRVNITDTVLYGDVNETITNFRLGNDGQMVSATKTRTKEPTTPTLDATTVSADVKTLGWGWFVVEEEKKPDVLPLPTTTLAQTVVPPPEYLNITDKTTVTKTVVGDALTPAPLGENGIGVVQSTAKQNTKFEGEITSTVITGEFNGTITEFQKNERGQKVTVTRTWGDSSEAPTLTAKTEIATLKVLGNNRFETTVGTVDNLFQGAEYSIERPRLIPAKLRAFLGEVQFTETVEGVATQPELGIGDLSASETQVTEFTKRVARRFANLPKDANGNPIPLVFTNEEFVPELNAVADSTETFKQEIQHATKGMNVLASKVEILGDGSSFKTEMVAQEVPPKISIDVEPFTGAPTARIIERVEPLPNASMVRPLQRINGVQVEYVPRGSYTDKVTTNATLPPDYPMPVEVHFPIPTILTGWYKYRAPGNSPYTVHPTFREGGVRKVMGKVYVHFTRTPKEPVLKGSFTEVSWSYPGGFSGRGLTDEQVYEYLAGTSSQQVDIPGFGATGFSARLPKSYPSAAEWLAMVGKEIIYGYRCIETKNGIFREETTKLIVPA